MYPCQYTDELFFDVLWVYMCNPYVFIVFEVKIHEISKLSLIFDPINFDFQSLYEDGWDVILKLKYPTFQKIYFSQQGVNTCCPKLSIWIFGR